MFWVSMADLLLIFLVSVFLSSVIAYYQGAFAGQQGQALRQSEIFAAQEHSHQMKLDAERQRALQLGSDQQCINGVVTNVHGTVYTQEMQNGRAVSCAERERSPSATHSAFREHPASDGIEVGAEFRHQSRVGVALVCFE